MMTDSDWFKKHKKEIENIRLIMENLKKTKRFKNYMKSLRNLK